MIQIEFMNQRKPVTHGTLDLCESRLYQVGNAKIIHLQPQTAFWLSLLEKRHTTKDKSPSIGKTIKHCLYSDTDRWQT